MTGAGPRGSAPAGRVAIEARGLCKEYRVFKRGDRGWLNYVLRPFGDRDRHYNVNRALSDIDLAVAHGETVGIVGRNGSGKSTLLKTLAGVSTPTAGTVAVNGRIRCLLGTGIGFHERLSGLENILIGSLAMGIPAATARLRTDQIVDFAELWDSIEQPTMFYSSGMRARLALAVALQEVPDILMLDEALAAGDAYFQAKCAERIREVCTSGSTVLIVTHSVETVIDVCARAILLDAGRIVIDSAPGEVVGRYRDLLVAQQRRRLESLEALARRGHERSAPAAGPVAARPLELVDSYMAGADGQRRSSFDHGEPLELHLRLRAARRLPRLRFALDLFADTDGGVRIAQLGTEHLSTDTRDLEIYPLQDLDGEYDLSVRFPANPLGSGHYYWTLRVGPFSHRDAGGPAEYVSTGNLCPFASVSFPGHSLGALRQSILEPETTYELRRIDREEELPGEPRRGVERTAFLTADGRRQER